MEERIKKSMENTIRKISEANTGDGGGIKLQPVKLLCEYLSEPEGIDTREPGFSWQIKTSKRKQRQKAYQILVASERALLSEGQGDMWDSGRVDSRESVNVIYQGRKLKSGRVYYWKVLVW